MDHESSDDHDVFRSAHFEETWSKGCQNNYCRSENGREMCARGKMVQNKILFWKDRRVGNWRECFIGLINFFTYNIFFSELELLWNSWKFEASRAQPFHTNRYFDASVKSGNFDMLNLFHRLFIVADWRPTEKSPWNIIRLSAGTAKRFYH